MYMYVIYEKCYIDRLGNKVDNEINIGDSDSVDGILKILENKRDKKITKRGVYKAIKTKIPIDNKYFVYKISKD